MQKRYIPYNQHYLDKEDINAVKEILENSWLTTGPKVEEFENAIKSYLNCKTCTVVSNGSAALDLAINSLNLKPNSEIITTPFTFAATSNSILYNNCIPVFADINKDTFNLDPEQIKKKITNNTKAILYVDYGGQPCNIDEIREIANKNDLFLIEDAAHAFGAEYKNKKIGTLADLTTFSFHVVKNITTGEGGAITTNNEQLAKTLKMLRNHGIDKEAKERHGPESPWLYDMKVLGRNYRLTDIQCALGLSQIKKNELFIAKRKQLAERYNIIFKENSLIKTPFIQDNIKHAWHLYSILLDEKINRDLFLKNLRKNNIGANLLYLPVYQLSYYKERFNINPKNFPVTENTFKRILSLPLFYNLSEQEQDYVVETVNNALK